MEGVSLEEKDQLVTTKSSGGHDFGVMAYLTEHDNQENDKLVDAVIQMADMHVDRIYLYLPLLVTSEKDVRNIEQRKVNGRIIINRYTDKLDHKKFHWTAFLAPTLKHLPKFRDIIEKYPIKKVVFEKSREEEKDWLKHDYEGNTIGCFLHDIEVTNSPSMDEYMTSSGTLKRKEEMNKKAKKKDHLFFKKKHGGQGVDSLLTDYN